LKHQARITARHFDAKIVVKVDAHAVTRGRAAIAAVVGAGHVQARLVQRREPRPARSLLPRTTAPANAFADRAAGAGKVETAVAVGHRKAEATAVRVGRA